VNNKNILFCSVGRRARLLMDFRQSMNSCGRLVATDLSPVAPALFFADETYLVPRITAPDYFDYVLDICEKSEIKAITTLIDPEIELMANHRSELLTKGVLPLCPADWTAHLCFDKYEMFRHLHAKGVRTVLTYDSLESFKEGLSKGEVSLPVFMKPISGSGSVGIGRCDTMEQVEEKWNDGKFTYIIQELMTGGDCDADVYVDCISHKPVAVFSKKKIESRIGGASKTISYKDPKLFAFVEEVCSVLELNGPCDMDFFIKDGEYYLSEINPRFGGAYLHAYGAGVDFIKLILNNIDGKENQSIIGQYDEDIVMMMYDDVVIKRKSELMSDNFSLL
jgi:carbamoyl-phosphate synthase large subunit